MRMPWFFTKHARRREERIRDLEAEVAALELTGDRAELQSLLDQCGLDFERARDRAIKAEARVKVLEDAVRDVLNRNGRDYGLTGPISGMLNRLLYSQPPRP